jgi:hypothetical protein
MDFQNPDEDDAGLTSREFAYLTVHLPEFSSSSYDTRRVPAPESGSREHTGRIHEFHDDQKQWRNSFPPGSFQCEMS